MSDYIYISGIEHRISELEAENKELKKALEQANYITKKATEENQKLYKLFDRIECLIDNFT